MLVPQVFPALPSTAQLPVMQQQQRSPETLRSSPGNSFCHNIAKKLTLTFVLIFSQVVSNFNYISSFLKQISIQNHLIPCTG